ncbi:GDP-L-fucose synthase [Candidatus Pelagibacter sp.]|nr:GDP-L-fucose synthase [Candidatus Pelagibacter sp.]
MKKIFIAGHKGMVGSAIFRKLKNKSNKIVMANKKKLNLLNQKSVLSFFKKNKFDEVYLCAAKVGGIHANNTYVADFIYQNLEIQNNFIHSAYLAKVKKLMFLGSSCVYPKKPKIPIKEDYLLTGELENTNEMYAIAKIAGLKMCKAYNAQFKTDFRAVMPTNLYGKNDNYDSLNSHVIAALIKKIVLAKKQNKKSLIVWGTGKPKREFLHVDDLADATIKIMNLSKSKYIKIAGKKFPFINIGSGSDISIKDLAKKISKIVGFKGKMIFDKSKPDGTFQKLMDNTKLKKIKWKPKISLNSGIKKTIEDFKATI